VGRHDPQRRNPAEAERRQLTVLFCDLVDSTRLSAQMDAEEWREVVSAYQECVTKVVDRFAGHVAQYLGDGMLVYFGWPAAHEDDAERAVRAGLETIAALETLNAELETRGHTSLAVRIGIHTGPLVVGETGGGAGHETLAMGETTNVAARLQGEAAPEAVLLSEATLRLAPGVFRTDDLGERRLRGLDAPVRVFRALSTSGVRSRLDATRASGLTPLVGREQELMLLEDRWAQVCEGRGQVVVIGGEAGIGKSRLMLAFRERLAGRPYTWLECAASPYTQESSFHPVIDLQRVGLGFAGGDTPLQKLERLEAGLAEAGFELGAVAPVFAKLHGLAMPEGRHPAPGLGPEGLRKRTLALLTEWLLRIGRQQPAILLVEDLHWLDPSTLELLHQAVDQVPTERILLLLTHRPEFEPPWGARSHVTPMLLARLTRGQLGDLVQRTARERALPNEWVEEIVERSDGVPLFAEELVRAVIEANPEAEAGDGAPVLRIPETLQDSLMARLDALGPAKEVAQLASVLGREFAWDLLLAVSPLQEDELARLLAVAVREELFYQRGAPPEASYLFKHALVRDVAYESMLRATRRRHHGRVAGALIDHFPDTVTSQPELVAHHLTAAGETEPAIEWWERAGEAARARVAHEEAIHHLCAGLAEITRLPEGTARDARELDLLLPLGTSLALARGYAHEETTRTFDRARQLCDEETEPRRAGTICFYLASSHASATRLERGLEFFRECERIGREHGDRVLEVAGLADSGQVYTILPRLTEGLRTVERACELYTPEGCDFLEAGFGEDVGISGWGWLAWLRWYAGHPDGSQSAAQCAQALAERVGDAHALGVARFNVACIAAFRRDWTEARRLAREAVHLTSEHGFALYESLAAVTEAWAAGVGARDPSAFDRYSEAVARAASTGTQLGAPLMVGIGAQLQLIAGRVAEAAQTIEGALGIAQATGQHFYDAELHNLRAECFLQVPGRLADDAEAELRRAVEIAHSQEAKSLELRAATSLASLWRDQRKREEARNLLQPVYDWFTEGFDTQDLKDAKALLEELA
jgi:class 3 adenylate cyclase/tetratricopeptide (TPR) repeat protein